MFREAWTAAANSSVVWNPLVTLSARPVSFRSGPSRLTTCDIALGLADSAREGTSLRTPASSMPPTSAAVIAEALPTPMPIDQHGPLRARDLARAFAKTVTLRYAMSSVSYMAEQCQIGRSADKNRV